MIFLFFYFQPPAHQVPKKRSASKKVGRKRCRKDQQPLNLCLKDITNHGLVEEPQPLNLKLLRPPRRLVDDLPQSQPLNLKLAPKDASPLLPIIAQNTLQPILTDMSAYYEDISEVVSIDTLYI